MIVNPDLLVKTQTVVNSEKFRKSFQECLLLNLYMKNYINKGEYEALCRQCK
jgi:hypothetical protein